MTYIYLHDKITTSPPTMPATRPAKPTDTLLLELAGISEQISLDTTAAAQALDAFRREHQPSAPQAVRAMIDLLTLVIASVRNTFDKQGIDDLRLIAYFKKAKKYDEAAQILVAKARHFFQNGNLAAGEKVLAEVREEYLGRISARVEVVYLTRMTFLYYRRHQYDEGLRASLQGLDKIRSIGTPGAWHYNISTVFYTNIANGYFSQSDFDSALPYLEKSLEITMQENISAYNKFNVYSYFAFYYESKGDHRLSAEWQERIIALLEGDATHQHYLIHAYLMAITQYSFLYRRTQLPAAERRRVQRRQEAYITAAAAIIPADLSNGNYLMYLYTAAMLEHQKGHHATAEQLLGQCMPHYVRMGHHSTVLNCTRLQHEIYYAWGRETADAQRLIRAYECKQEEARMIEEASMQSHLQKLESARLRHHLEQQELSRRLLEQQIEAMNKEIQLTAINLQEKVTLLDELKAYILSVKKTDSSQRALIRMIVQKIGAVKITEHEKAVLQQKLDEGNQGLYRIVAELYPDLTPLEVRTCGLLKTGMTDKELSRIYGSGYRGYEQMRYRIKKKMKLTRTDNLVRHLMELSTRSTAPERA